MNKFKTLLKMQLKEKFDLSFMHRKKQAMFKIVFSILGFIVVALAAYLLLSVGNILGIFASIGRVPLSVMTFLLVVITALNIVTCTIGLSKELYYAKDNQVLITLAVSANQIFLSKMCVYFIKEIKKSFNFLIPIFVAYGFVSNLEFIYFIWMPIMLVIYSAIPVLVGGILSIPVNFVIAFFKRAPAVKIIITILFMGSLIYAVVKLINLIPEDIDLISSWVTVSKVIRAVLSWTTQYLAVFHCVVLFLCGKPVLKGYGYVVKMFTNYSWSVFLGILAVIAVLTVLNYYLSRPVYLKLISRQFEYKKKEIKRNKKNKKASPFYASCKYEIIRFLRDENLYINTIITMVVAPITILLLNKIYGAINTRLFGDLMTIGFNILIILLFTLAHNINVASIFSRDGDSLKINKTKPTGSFMSVLPKLAYNFISTFIILALCCATYCINSKTTIQHGIMLFLIMLFTAFSHIVWCADIDFCNPKPELFATEGSKSNSPNEIKSTILTFAMSIVVTAFMVLLLFKAESYIYFRMTILMFLFFVLRMVLFARKIKTLYREI